MCGTGGDPGGGGRIFANSGRIGGADICIAIPAGIEGVYDASDKSNAGGAKD